MTEGGVPTGEIGIIGETGKGYIGGCRVELGCTGGLTGGNVSNSGGMEGNIGPVGGVTIVRIGSGPIGGCVTLGRGFGLLMGGVTILSGD